MLRAQRSSGGAAFILNQVEINLSVLIEYGRAVIQQHFPPAQYTFPAAQHTRTDYNPHIFLWTKVNKALLGQVVGSDKYKSVK